jgi:hypothetical protein
MAVKDGRPNALTFGIYPGSAIGDTELTGPPDRPDKINQALARLQGSPGRPFIVRAYEAYADAGDTVHTATSQTPAGYDRYLGHGRMLDYTPKPAFHVYQDLIDTLSGDLARLAVQRDLEPDGLAVLGWP